MSDVIETNDLPEPPEPPLRRLYEYTPLIRTTDMTYPLFLRDFRRQYPNVTMTVNSIDAYIVAEYNYLEVWLVDAPTEGDVITEGFPVYNESEDKWYQTWDVRPFTTEEVAANLAYAKEVVLNQASNTIAQDLAKGVVVSYDNVEYRVPSTAGDRVDWANALLMLLNKTNTDLHKVRTMDGFVEMTAADATLFYQTSIETHFVLTNAYYQYVDSVKATTLIGDIPETPETFFGEVVSIPKTTGGTESTTTTTTNR